MSTTTFTREAAQAFDRDARERIGAPGIVLMENAGRGCVEVLERVGMAGPTLVVCGSGHNAGDGFVIARHLVARGYHCRVALAAPPSSLPADALTALKMLTPCSAPILDETGLSPATMVGELDRYAGDSDWIVDALLGVGAKGPPRPPYDAVVEWMNAETARRLAIDLPTGLDCDTGEPSPTTVRADHTCTFVAPKAGFANPAARPFLGQVHVVGIGVPGPPLEGD